MNEPTLFFAALAALGVLWWAFGGPPSSAKQQRKLMAIIEEDVDRLDRLISDISDAIASLGGLFAGGVINCDDACDC